MKIPGEIFKKHINAGKPSINGWYVCYIRPDKRSAWNAVPMTVIKTKLWSDDKWAQADHVIGWMGPLPVFSLDEIQGELGPESESSAYAIGTLKGGKQSQFTGGPFDESIRFMFEDGEPGEYCFELNSRKSEPTPILRWSESLAKWVKLDNKCKPIKIRKNRKNKVVQSYLPYYIGTKKQAASDKYKYGPYNGLMEALSVDIKKQKKGLILWMIFEGNAPFPERIWDGAGWEILDIVKIRKIEKIIKILRNKYEKG